MKKFAFTIIAIFAFAVVFSNAKTSTIYKPNATYIQPQNLDGNPFHFIDGTGNAVDPINRLNVNLSTYIPQTLSFAGGFALYPTKLHADFLGNIIMDDDLLFAASKLRATNQLKLDYLAGHVVWVDASGIAQILNLGTGLALNTGTGTLSISGAGSGNVTTTPTGGTFANLTMYDADNSANIVPSGVIADGSGNAIVNNFRINGTLTFNGVAMAAISSGHYAPTISAVVNASGGSSSYNCHWTRVGDTVTVDGRIGLTTLSIEAGTIAQCEISLPPGLPAPNFAAAEDCTGQAVKIVPVVASSPSAPNSGSITAQIAHQKALLQFRSSVSGDNDYTFHFTYQLQ